MKFFHTINDKRVEITDDNSLKTYKHICDMIWGGRPYDITWAIKTSIYENKLKEYNEKRIILGNNIR